MEYNSPRQDTCSNTNCGCLGGFKRRRRRPGRRVGHTAIFVPTENCLLVWGGRTHGGLFLEEKYLPSAEIWAFCTKTEKWWQVITNGEPPPGTSGAVAAQVENAMYVIGGFTGTRNTSEVYRFDLKTKYWSHLPVPDDADKPSPRDKFVAWEFRNRIYIFGGFGVPLQGYLKDHGDFVSDNTNNWNEFTRGWNNQLLCFDTSTNSWSNLPGKGDVPTPRAAHAVASMGDKLYLFGGRHNHLRLNDLYLLNMQTHHWTRGLLL